MGTTSLRARLPSSPISRIPRSFAMAASMVFASIAAPPRSYLADGRLPSKPSLSHSFRCRAEGRGAGEPDERTAPPTQPAKKASASLFDVLAFSGPGPERINGRLAMVGFVSAIAVEVASGNGLFEQVSDGGLRWFTVAVAVLSAASLVPLLKGEEVKTKSGTLMSADAEMWNGRFAMLGLVALAFTEFVTGAPLV